MRTLRNVETICTLESNSPKPNLPKPVSEGLDKKSNSSIGKFLKKAMEALKELTSGTSPKKALGVAALALGVAVVSSGCGKQPEPFLDFDGGVDTATDTFDTDTGTDADTDTDTDSDIDADADTDTDADADMDVDTDADTDTNTESDTGTGEPLVPDEIEYYVEGSPSAPISFEVDLDGQTCSFDTQGAVAIETMEGMFSISGIAPFMHISTTHVGGKIYVLPAEDMLAEMSPCTFDISMNYESSITFLGNDSDGYVAYPMADIEAGMLKIDHLHNETERAFWVFDPDNYATPTGEIEVWFSSPAGEHQSYEVVEMLGYSAVKGQDNKVRIYSAADSSSSGMLYELTYSDSLSVSDPIMVGKIPNIGAYVSGTILPENYETLGGIVVDGKILELPNL